jgi:CheY-like chemotaxis protein
VINSTTNRPRTLIADDEERLREALVNMLEIHGFQVVGVAASGTEAIALFDAAHPTRPSNDTL